MSSGKTLLLTGLPRSGTTLCCHLLNDCRNVLALHEPMTPTDFDVAAGRARAVKQIAGFARDARISALSRGRVITRQKDGKVPENPVAYESAADGLRPMDVSLGEIDVSARTLDEQFTLVIKHNALFTALLPELAEAFPVYAVVRNPLSVLASWNSVALPVNQGRIPAGEMFSPDLAQALDATPDAIGRQLLILEWFCSRILNHLNGRVLRYEAFVVNPAVVSERMGLGVEAGAGIVRSSRNQSYNKPLMEQLYQRLQGFGDAIWQLYSPAEVDRLMADIMSA